MHIYIHIHDTHIYHIYIYMTTHHWNGNVILTKLSPKIVTMTSRKMTSKISQYSATKNSVVRLSVLMVLLIKISVTTALSQYHHRLCKYDLVYIALYTHIYVLSNIAIAISDNNNWPDKWYVPCNIETGHSTSFKKWPTFWGRYFQINFL